jgi:dipeptidyl aminopeptidase/acylaminoacyl peptidase
LPQFQNNLPIIPRAKLFGNPSYSGAQISPDGVWLSWAAPFENVLNIWVAPLDDLAAAEPVTRTKGRPIDWHYWSCDSAYLIYGNDENGDENLHYFVVDPKTKSLRDLTPMPDITALHYGTSWQMPRTTAIGLNDRDARWHDLYHLNLDSGERTLIFENNAELESIFLDNKLQPRMARSALHGGGVISWSIEGGKLIEVERLSYEDSLNTRPVSFNHDGSKLLCLTTVGRDTSALVERDLKTGKERVLASHPEFDIWNIFLHPQSFELQLISVNGAAEDWIFVSDDLKHDWAILRAELAGFETSPTSVSFDNRHCVIAAHKPKQGVTYFHFDRNTKNLRELFRARPEMKSYRLAPMEVIKVKSRDGLSLYSLLTLPAELNGQRPSEPLPMVLKVHGGPWGQDTYGYNREDQWLANRGYAVLSVNYRGSTGYGKAFTAAAQKQHAAKMHDDLIDMVNWAISEGIANPEKIAITGASYGGYASFVGATFTPDVFCCAVPVVGITNLQTLLENKPPYWAGFAEFVYQSYGDPRTEEGRKLLADRSPIHKVENISKPMLIFHGQNDVRCKVSESDTIVAAMQTKNIPVTYVVYPDEGHGFYRHENQMSYYAIAEAFFAKHLGGRCESFGTDLKGSSHEVRAGKIE